MWQEAVTPYVEAGDMVALGAVQEQHPDRTRLYRQWRELDWPIFVDSLNTLRHITVVPVPMAIDENGIVIDAQFQPNELDDFLARPEPDQSVPEDYNRAAIPDLDQLRTAAESDATSEAWLKYGAALFNYTQPQRMNDAVEALEQAVELNPENGQAHFALGGALRRRYEQDAPRPDDAQRAVDHWSAALDVDPNHYIWRRRLQQYGPRLDKPYNFYFWVQEARKDIRARSEEPVELSTEPMGSEIAPPDRSRDIAVQGTIPNPDPEGRIHRDERGLVQIEKLATPARIKPGQRARIRLTFRLNPRTAPWWNNEADHLRVWVDLPEGYEWVAGEAFYPNPAVPETRELRQIEFEVQSLDDASPGGVSFPGYALYYVCENAGGVCYFLRQDFTLSLTVDSGSTPLS